MSIQNQQPNITKIISLNGSEITEHNRQLSTAIETTTSDVEMGDGKRKRFIKRAKNIYTLRFSYLPTKSDKTIDGRAARDYLISLMSLRTKISLSIKLDPNESNYNTYVYADSYNETLVKRDIANNCAYYDVEITLREA
jgi:hypothetical protein